MGPAGSRALAASGPRAGRPAGVPGPVPRAAPRLRIRRTPRLEVLVLVLLLLSFNVLVTAAPVHDQPAAPQGERPPQITCPPGQFLSREGTCKPCILGMGYTSHPNDLASCMPCSICREDTYRKSSCTTTRDTECLCKEGTFRGRESPEFCLKCTECTNNEIEASSCTPWSDRECIPKESNTNITGNYPAYEKSGTAAYIGIIVTILVILLFLIFICCYKTQIWKKIPLFMKGTCAGHGNEDPTMNRTFLDPKPSDPETDSHHPMVSTKTTEAERCPTGTISSNGSDSDSVNLLQQKTLTDDETQVARSQTQDPGNRGSQMVLKCPNQNCHCESIHVQQCALDGLGASDIQDTVENHVGAWNFFHPEEIDDSAL